MKPTFLKSPLLLFFISFVIMSESKGFSQSVGIGTTSPNAKAALEIKSTNKGILFPRMTSAQRNAISNPPDGLHIYNTDERCLNYFDSIFQVWNCYCVNDTCKVVTIIIKSGCNVDFYNTYGIRFPGVKKFFLLIDATTTISCGSPIIGALNFNTIPGTDSVSIKIINRGSILGAGGGGGSGFTGQVGDPCGLYATAGSGGGSAITTRYGVIITIDNYGIVAGGGGGGGGGGGTVLGEIGGGGGGGAGNISGIGGVGGGQTFTAWGGCGTYSSIAQNGTNGQLNSGGSGGTESSGRNGGNGGNRGQPGQNGIGTNPGSGGAAGRAIAGGSGNAIINLSGGQSFGLVD